MALEYLGKFNSSPDCVQVKCKPGKNVISI